MKVDFGQHTKWIAVSIILAAIIILFLPNSIYKNSQMVITRGEAINKAERLLQKQGIDINNYYVEGLLDENSTSNRYLIKKLGTSKYEELNKLPNIPSYGWTLYFHKNLSKEIAQTNYKIALNYKGEFTDFLKETPDSASSPSFSSEKEAETFIRNFLSANIESDLSGLNVTEKRSFQMAKRTDYLFTFEKVMPGFDSLKYVINTRVQGNKLGYIYSSFYIPQNESGFFETEEVFYGTISIIFVFFFILFALFHFLKKYHQGEIWMSMGKNFFILYFIISFICEINSWPGGGLGLTLGNMPFTTTKFIVFAFQVLILNFIVSLLVFSAWSVGESLTRGLWPEKYRGIDAFIKGKIFTITSGASLLKGFTLGLGASLLYLVTGSIINKSSAYFFINPVKQIKIYSAYLPALDILTSAITTGLVTGAAITFFVTNLSYYKFRSTKISVIITGLVSALSVAIVYTPPSLNVLWINLIISFLTGCLFAYVYLRFDLLVLLSFIFHTIIITKGFTLYFGSEPFYKWNSISVLLMLLAVPVIYIISRIKKEEFVLEDYGAPSHIQKISERERLKKELEIASKVQLSLLPKEQPHVAGYDIAGLSIPAVEAGGDYFDFVKLQGNKLGIAIGDVSGKGVGAAIYMTLTKGILQAHAEENVSPKTVLTKVNKLLYKTIEKNSFVSMFYAVLDISDHSMIYSRAGHNPGILCSNENGSTKLLMSRGIALGLEEGHIFTSTLIEESIILAPLDLVILYTDGFTEAMNEKEEFYGEEKLIDFIKTHRNLSSKELINAILKEVNKFTGNMPQHDDMTIVAIKRQ